MKVIFFCGPPGVKLTERTKNIANYIRNYDRDFNVEIYDIEEYLKNAILEDLRNKGEETTIGDILRLYSLPRQYLENKWKDVVKKITESISNIENTEEVLVFLVGHLIYYIRSRDEFFQAADFTFLNSQLEKNNVKVDRVVLLIDDVYDMMLNLSDLWKADRISRGDKETIHLYPYSCLKTVLFWRYSESLAAQRLAGDLNAKFTVYAIEQGLVPLVNLILGKNSHSFYLSHPITHVRASGDTDFQKEVVSLQKLLDDEGITLVMPTAIDELRIKEDAGLMERWALPETTSTWPLISKSEYADDKIKEYLEEEIFCHVISLEKRGDEAAEKEECKEKVQKIEKFFNDKTLVASLKDDILRQIAFRDFQIIYSTDGIFVYRPLYQGRRMSSGVRDELNLANRLNQHGVTRKIVIVNIKEDLNKFLKNLSQNEASNILNSTGWNIPEEKRNKAINLKNFLNSDQTEGSLSNITQYNYKRDDLEKEIKEMCKEFFYKSFLSKAFGLSFELALDDIDTLALILLFDTIAEFEDNIENIVKWIREEKPDQSFIARYNLYSYIDSIIERVVKAI